MNRLNIFFKNYRWAILSGLMMGTTYIPFPPWALLLCWVPLWWDLLKTESPLTAFFKGWWTQFLLTLIGFYWISYVSHEFAFLPWPVAILILFLFSALAHLYIPVAAMIAVYLRKRFQLGVGSTLLILASLQNLGEAYWPSIFSWNLGYPLLYVQSGIAQWSDIIGFLGLSYLVHLLQAQLTLQLVNPRKKQIWIGTACGFTLLVIATLTGPARKQKWQGQQTFSAAMIQANIGNLEKIYAERGTGYQAEIFSQYFRLSKLALSEAPKTDVLIWPESAAPEYLDTHNQTRRYSGLFFDELKNLKVSLITGAYSNDPPETKPREDYNALFVFDENGQQTAPAYHKTHLLIFGEYVPLGSIFPILRKWNPGGEGFGVGTGPEVLPWRDLKVGPQICYDSLYPFFSANLAKKGADFLVNVTNDSWFGPHFEPEQHMYMTLARALEVRRPLLRSTNTGITTVIDAQGKIMEQSPIGQEWFHTYEVPYIKNAELTFYSRFGVFLSLIPLFVIGLSLGVSARATSRLE